MDVFPAHQTFFSRHVPLTLQISCFQCCAEQMFPHRGSLSLLRTRDAVPIWTLLLQAYETDDNMIISAPTGAGKTVLFEIAMIRIFRTNPTGQIIYLAPTKSLCSERFRDWKNKFSTAQVKCKGQSIPAFFSPEFVTSYAFRCRTNWRYR